VRTARLAVGENILYHNLGNGTFEDITTKAHIDQTNGHYSFSVSTFDYDDDGWPDIFVACDSTASILYHNNRDGTFTDVAVVAGARSMMTGASRPAWAPRSATMMAMAGWIFSKQIFQTIPPHLPQQWRRDV